MPRKAKQTRSLRQQWHSKRKWELQGRINGVITTLIQTANSLTILPAEAKILYRAVEEIRVVAEAIRGKSMDTASFNYFKEKRAWPKD
jgi:hypothetical protein